MIEDADIAWPQEMGAAFDSGLPLAVCDESDVMVYLAQSGRVGGEAMDLEPAPGLQSMWAAQDAAAWGMEQIADRQMAQPTVDLLWQGQRLTMQGTKVGPRRYPFSICHRGGGEFFIQGGTYSGHTMPDFTVFVERTAVFIGVGHGLTLHVSAPTVVGDEIVTSTTEDHETIRPWLAIIPVGEASWKVLSARMPDFSVNLFAAQTA